MMPLRRVLCRTAVSLANPSKIAVAAAGFGETDAASDIAHGGGSFDDVCAKLAEVVGPAAETWEQLSSGKRWYLGPPEARS